MNEPIGIGERLEVYLDTVSNSIKKRVVEASPTQKRVIKILGGVALGVAILVSNVPRNLQDGKDLIIKRIETIRNEQGKNLKSVIDCLPEKTNAKVAAHVKNFCNTNGISQVEGYIFLDEYVDFDKEEYTKATGEKISIFEIVGTEYKAYWAGESYLNEEEHNRGGRK